MSVDLTPLIASLRSDDSARQQAAAEKLAQMGPAAQPAAVALVEACDADDETRESAVAALEDLGPPLETDIAKLAALVERPSLDVAYWATTLLGRLGAQAGTAVPSLSKALGNHAELAVKQRAAWALGRIGPAAGAARATLQAAAASTDARLAALASEALNRLST